MGKQTRYSIEGKIETATSENEFIEGMKHGEFLKPIHRAYCVLLYYSAVRTTEALRTLRESFQITESAIMFDVGVRLKHSKRTPALLLPFEAPYMIELKDAIEEARKGECVFGFCRKTGYNVVRRVWHYPHLFRLSRITRFFLDGWTIPQVRSWTGLSLRALEFYVAIVDTAKMGESLARKVE